MYEILALCFTLISLIILVLLYEGVINRLRADLDVARQELADAKAANSYAEVVISSHSEMLQDYAVADEYKARELINLKSERERLQAKLLHTQSMALPSLLDAYEDWGIVKTH